MKRISIYELCEYDGGDGRYNRPTGFYTHDKQVAKEWQASVNGRSVRGVSGVMIDSLAEMKDATRELKRIAALNLLSAEQKELLGLADVEGGPSGP